MRKGSKHTAESRARMAAVKHASGEDHPFFGRMHSEESRAKMSAALVGDKHPNWGKSLPAETRSKISAAQRGRPGPRGDKHPMWRGGRRRHEGGYVLVHCPEHPLAAADGYAYEHRVVLSERIGRPLLSEEQVHHVNEVRDDNRAENLWLWPDASSHTIWHAMTRTGRDLWTAMPPVALDISL